MNEIINIFTCAIRVDLFFELPSCISPSRFLLQLLVNCEGVEEEVQHSSPSAGGMREWGTARM